MANPFLIVVTVILSLVIIAGCIYILVYFQHPEDKLVAWVPKVVVVLSLTLVCFSVLMLPLDVANNTATATTEGHHDGGFPMDVLWQVVYITMAVLAVVVIPFAAFYYEGDEYDEEGGAATQLAGAIKGTFISALVFVVVAVVMYIPLGIAEIPTARMNAVLQTVAPRQVALPLNITTNDNSTIYEIGNCTAYIVLYRENITSNSTTNSTSGNFTVNITTITHYMAFTFSSVNESNFRDYYGDNVTNITCNYYDNRTGIFDLNATSNAKFEKTFIQFRVSFALWLISIIVFFGWVLFIVFGGIGMIALPMDCIASWKKRPIRITLDKYTTIKREIGEQATKLLEKGKAIQERQKKGKERKRDRRNYNKFRQAVFMLEEDYERLQECYKRQGGKLILHFLTFVFGLLSACLTALWLLHIILYMFTYPYPITPFLNAMVVGLDDAFPLLGTAAYGLFSFYLLLCCIKGNFKFGMRLFFFPIHPMRVGNTLMHAFLFNVALIVICSFAVTQFCTLAFADYTSLTDINSMFGLAVNNLKGLKYIFIGYIYVLFIMVFLTGIYFVFKPKDKPAIDDIN